MKTVVLIITNTLYFTRSELEKKKQKRDSLVTSVSATAESSKFISQTYLITKKHCICHAQQFRLGCTN